jgi:ParB family transcriptional regulator, chromosome partitioning protein
MAQQYGLGRGLASLIPPKKDKSPTPSAVFKDEPILAPLTTSHPDMPITREISLGDIVPNPHQPRLHFDEAKLAELAESIRAHGILQPLVVSEVGPGKFELIAGERRLQAAKRAGLATVPVVVRQADNQEKLELAIIENIQRHNLNPIEEARAYLRLTDEFGLQQEEVAKKMGKSRPTIANTLRLLTLPVEIQRAIVEGKITEGHAKALLSIENPEKQRALFDLIIKDELTVREAEEKARDVSVRTHLRKAPENNPELVAKEEWLTEQLGTKVRIQTRGKGGKITIEYYSAEDLNGILGRLA